jgi:bacteriochlorophyll 4-vinyl reductase
MVDAGIGRLLVASLHQGISDVAPTRLPFYEHWLTPPSSVGPRFGLAPLHAVLSFLRLEGQTSYEQIMRRAGGYTADWGYSEISPVARGVVHRLPVAARARAVLFLSRRLVRDTFRGSRARTRVSKGAGTIEIKASIFCAVREPTDWPMCVFYSAAVERFLQRFDLDASVGVRECKACGGRDCTMRVTIRGDRLEQAAVEAA